MPVPNAAVPRYADEARKFSLLDQGVFNQPACPLLILNGMEDSIFPSEDSLIVARTGRNKDLMLRANLPHMGNPGGEEIVCRWIDDMLAPLRDFNRKETPMKTDRIVAVTGAAGGMGKLFVERFLNNGDTVIATDSGEDGLAKLAADLKSDRLFTTAADISDEADTKAFADFAREKAGRVDVLVNVAGWFPIQPFAEITAEDFRKVIDINLTGTFLMIKAVYPLMTGRGWGRIINIGSASTFEGVATQVHYVAAKSGFFGLTRSIARAVGGEGITANVVTPGLTVTPAVKEKFPEDLLNASIEARAIQREEAGADLVGAVFFLASPDADFISGQTINVDGGAHMH